MLEGRNDILKVRQGTFNPCSSLSLRLNGWDFGRLQNCKNSRLLTVWPP